ncbi:MAG: thiolase family protein [Kofleriaceae bacterium]
MTTPPAKTVAICGYARTGIAKARRGALNATHGIPMLAHAVRHAVARAGVAPDEIEDCVVGCGFPEGATGHNIARNAVIAAGLPQHTPGMTLTRYCASGISAVDDGVLQIASGAASMVIAGGVESLSLVQPKLNLNGFVYPPLQATDPGLWWPMIQTADYVAAQYGVTREEQDRYVVESQRRVAAAIAGGVFAEEIVPFRTVQQVVDPAGAASMVEVELRHDEGPRPDTTYERLAALQPVAGGTVTAGNASQLSDGAAALVLVDAELAARRGLPILGTVRPAAVTAVDPREMSIAIAPAVQRLMRRDGITAAAVDLWELHEAFAVTTVYNQRVLETPWAQTNVNGGAIALGHPYGMSGVRYVGSLALELGRRGARRGIVGVCSSGGMGIALMVERP